MNKNTLFFIGLTVALLILSACEKSDVNKVKPVDSDKIIVCNPPYMRFAEECCLDIDDNKICDKDEKETASGQLDVKTESEIDDYELDAPVFKCSLYLGQCHAGIDITNQEYDPYTNTLTVTFKNNHRGMCDISCYYVQQPQGRQDFPEMVKYGRNYTHSFYAGQDINLVCGGRCGYDVVKTIYELKIKKVDFKVQCTDSCSRDICRGYQFVECARQPDGCLKPVYKGKVPGKCSMPAPDD